MPQNIDGLAQEIWERRKSSVLAMELLSFLH